MFVFSQISCRVIFLWTHIHCLSKVLPIQATEGDQKTTGQSFAETSKNPKTEEPLQVPNCLDVSKTSG